jgi:methionine-R-sulfoxide reductase
MNHLLMLNFLAVIAACQPAERKMPETPIVKTSISMDTTKKIVRTEEEWKKILTPEQYHILREKGTDRPFTGNLTYNMEKGMYTCAACGNELFTSDMKYESNCGWPAFDREIAGGKVVTKEDRSFGMVRTEIMCGKCGSHLGHLFDDGETETGMRYCVNSTSLSFTPSPATKKKD